MASLGSPALSTYFSFTIVVLCAQSYTLDFSLIPLRIAQQEAAPRAAARSTHTSEHLSSRLSPAAPARSRFWRLSSGSRAFSVHDTDTSARSSCRTGCYTKAAALCATAQG